MGNLEERLIGQGSGKFRSEGERRIADFLESNSIKYHYEPALLVTSGHEKLRIWYPDYYLPEFGVYIEYFGLVGRQSYDEGVKAKETQYSKTGLAVIPVYPWTFAGNWQEYIMKELEQISLRRYESLMAKPYWSQHRSTAQRHDSPKTFPYRQNVANPW